MSRAWSQSQLDAGGLVGVDVDVDEKSTETIVARTYGAPVLGDRVVVRLASDRLVPAEDLSMEFLGLEAKSSSEPIARQNRTSLEFGHWALIHQPKHAKYALDLVKRMKAAARKASSKAGHAWDLYVEMAEELNKSVRHFLPAFWEQAARAYKDIGNTTYAGRALSKALEAERVHSLEVDREHRRDAILEFTLSGCLSGKALNDYAKDLEKQFPPLEAYETYKDLIVRRTLGGMAPVASTAADLTRMAKAAKLDVDEQIESVLEAMITSPAMSRAPMQFWKSVKKQVGRIVERNPTFAMYLLAHTNPVSSYRGDSPVWEWIEMLEQWNVLPYLSMPAAKRPQGIDLPGGCTGWFSRVASVETSPNKRVFDLLELMAPAIREEKQPIQLGGGYRIAIDVDVLDMALGLGLDVAVPERAFDLNFEGWLREEIDHARRNSSLSHVCNHERFRVELLKQIPELAKFRGDHSKSAWGRTIAPRRPFEEAAASHETIKKIWWEFIDKQLNAIEKSSLADFEIAQELLDSSCRPKTAELFPELVQRLKKIDMVACLQRTLRSGLLDEYGWEQLDRAADASPIPKSTKYGRRSVFLGFPTINWMDKDKLHCVSMSDYSSCEVLLKKNQSLQVALPVGSQFAIIYQDSDEGWKSFLRWSSNPQENIELSGYSYYYADHCESILPVGSDGVFTGERVFRAGDTIVPQFRPGWYHDGQRFWRITNDRYFYQESPDTRNAVSEIDPTTGKIIRSSVPPFFEEGLPTGSNVLWQYSHLQTKPVQTGESPLGEKDGLIGLRCIRRRDGAIESMGVDGRSWIFSKDEQPDPVVLAAVAIINKPAAQGYWIAASDGRLIDSETRQGFGFYSQRDKYFAGTPCELPIRFLHLLRVRCESTSKALRSLTIKDAESLLEAGMVEREARAKKEDPNNPDPHRDETRHVVAKLFSKAPARLIQGIARIARVAADESFAIQLLLKRLEKPKEAATPTQSLNKELIDAGFLELALERPEDIHFSYGSDSNLSEHLLMLAKFFAGNEIESVVRCSQYWFALLTDLPSVAWKTFWKRAIRDDGETDKKVRVNGAWTQALRMFGQSGLFDLPGSFTLFRCNVDEQKSKDSQELLEELQSKSLHLFVDGNYRYAAYYMYAYPSSYIFILGYHPRGECKAPKQFAIEQTTAIETPWNKRQLEAFLDSLAKLETFPLPTSEKLESASARVGLHPISVALLWMGNLRTTHYGQDKLSKELREHYGWKVADIQTAIAELNAFTVPKGLYLKCVPEPSYFLARHERNFDAMIDALAESRQAVVPFPPEITKELDRAFSGYYGLPMKEFNQLIMAPQDAELLKVRKVEFVLPTRQRSYSNLEVQITPKPKFEPSYAYSKIGKAISLLNYRLPVGHPIRRQIPEAINAIRTFLDHPESLLHIGATYVPLGDDKSDMESVINKLATTMGKFTKDSNGIYRCETDQYIVGTIPTAIQCYFRTASLKTPKDYQLLVGALQPLLQSEYYGSNPLTLNFVRQMKSDAMSELIACNSTPKIADGLWEQCPLHSVPHLVNACTKQLGIDELAAALYLQLLALPDPTLSNIKLWNDWNAKQLKSAGAQLLEKELVVEAKRERAGRDIFLPGGWEALKAPNLPIETWKLTHFGYTNTDALRGGSAEYIVVERSITSLFETVWNRYQRGDVPAYADAPSKSKKSKK